jgi:hypothetical protein
MTKPLRLRRNFIRAFVALVALPLGVRALESNEWKNRQSLPIDRSGVVKIALPPATLDAARPRLEDLRVLDASGRETPYLIEHAAPSTPIARRMPKSFRPTLVDNTTQLLIETGATEPIEAVALATPGTGFLKSARIEISNDGTNWETVQTGAPLFIQFGAVQLQIDVGRRTASHLRITIDDARTPPVPFTAAALLLAVTAQPAPVTPLDGVHISQREEFAGQTVLTLVLGAQHVPLAGMEIVAGDALFARTVSVAVRELDSDTAVERTLASGSIYRVAADGLVARAKLELPLGFDAPARELLIHIANGDSPPLMVQDVRVQQHPVWLVFRAAESGTYQLLTGNPDASAPRYDLATFAATLKATTPLSLAPGPIEPNPGYHRRDTLADINPLGGPIDPGPWRRRKPVQLATAGVQQLELDLEVLARSRNNLADLRLVRDGVQVPYLVERTSLARSVALTPMTTPELKRPQLSRWELKLPCVGAPLSRLMLKSTMTLFQRHVRVFDRVANDRGESYERTLAEADWSKTPGTDHPLILRPAAPASGDKLWIETDNGDNPSFTLTAVQADYPVVRLLFKASGGALTLYYDNPEIPAPRYDVALVAPQLLAAEKGQSALGPEQESNPAGWAERVLGAARGGVLFWAALAIVVVVLLVVVAKLLPKPPAPTA